LTRGIGRPVIATVSRYFLRSRAKYSNTRYSFFSQWTMSSSLHTNIHTHRFIQNNSV